MHAGTGLEPRVSRIKIDEWREQRNESRAYQWWLHHQGLAAAIVLLAAFAVRVYTAWGTFLNADEALHFSVANQHSLLEAYRASFTISHPPLLIFILYFWKVLGTSELILRLPSVLAGTAFCWLSFKWAGNLFGRAAGWSVFILASFLPTMIAISAEVRQYALLLTFVAGALYFLERALERNSTGAMAMATAFLYLALLTHYSAVPFAAALAVYSVLRIVRHPVPRRLVAAWTAGQAGGVGVCAFLYFTSLREQAKFFARQPLHGFMSESYLHSSYLDAQHNAFWFVAARTGSIFQYVFGQMAIGDVAVLLFTVGIVVLARQKTPPGPAWVRARVVALWLALPFVVNSGLGLAGVYPYGGTRHCIFLAPFVLAGTGFLIARAVRQRMMPAAGAAMAIAVVCNLTPSHHSPYMERSSQSSVKMREATSFVEQQIPASDLILADDQTGLLLAHYLCRQQPVAWDRSLSGFQAFSCANHQVLATSSDNYLFNSGNFTRAWEGAVRGGRVNTGEPVWVVQAGWLWEGGLAEQLLRTHFGAEGAQVQAYGKNISIFRMPAGFLSGKSNLLAVRQRG